MTDIHASNSHFEKNQMKFSYLNRGTGVEALFFGSSLLFMLYSNSWSYEVQWKANRQIIELASFL